MMAVVGVWLWSSPAHFERSQDQNKLLPVDSTRPPFECTSITLLGLSVPIQSPELRAWFLLLYSFFLVPALNLVVPALLFLALYINTYRLRPPLKISWEHNSWELHLLKDNGATGVAVGLIFLLIINIFFMVDNCHGADLARDHTPNYTA
jgi:hypothetical protein